MTVLVKAPAGFRRIPTVKYAGTPANWFTHSPVVRPCIHKEWVRGKSSYVDPGYRINDKGEIEKRHCFGFESYGKWFPLPKKARVYLDAIFACEPVVTTTSNEEGRRQTYIDVREITNPRVTNEGLCLELGAVIEFCS